MKVRIVCYEDLDLWILGKFARKMNLELNALGIQCDIGSTPDPDADINHHIIYYYYDGKPSTIDTVMITHIDEDWKLERVKNQLTVAPMGICMSAATVTQLANSGVPRSRLSHVLPAHDRVMRPRKIVIGITSKIHSDGRKRELLLLDLADQISASEFSFKIMGAGWDFIVENLRKKGFHVEYHNAFDFQLNQQLVPSFDYYLYLGLDEGAMGFVDALAAGVKTIATPQGYHLEAVNGITHPFVTLDELASAFHQISAERHALTNAVASWNWQDYALRHIEIWDYLLTGEAKRLLESNRHDGIDSIAIDESTSTSTSISAPAIEPAVRPLSRKKILIVCSHFWPSTGGLESRMGQFSAELTRAGYYVTVLTQVFPGRDTDTLNGVRIISAPSADFPAHIRKHVLSADYDACILIQDPLGAIIWSVEGLKPPEGTRLLIQPIINEDGYAQWRDHPSFGSRLAKIFTEVGTPVVMTKSGPDTRYMRSVGIDAAYLPNATTPTLPAGDFRAQYGIAPDQFLILHVANLFWVKNHLGLIDVLQDLPPQWKLVMIGNPSGEPDCVDAVKSRLSTRPDILFIPGLPRDWVAAAMQAADVVVLASKGEGSPITILEAMSHGKTWLATPECGAANDHLGGFICDLPTFREYLQALHNMPQWRDALGSISLAHWQQSYSWPVAMQGWIDLIEHGRPTQQQGMDDQLGSQMLRLRVEVLKAIRVNAMGVGASHGVSVIIPTYNRPEMLDRCLLSVAQQIYLPMEVIVVNDAGVSVASVVEKYSASLPIRLIEMESNGGAARARNAGLHMAQGDYIAFLDDDDEYLPQHLLRLVDALLSSGAHFAYTRADYLTETHSAQGLSLTRSTPFAQQTYSRETLLVGNYIPTPTWCFSRSLLKNAGDFNESFEAWEDWEWLIRASAHTPFVCVPQTTVLVHQRQGDAGHLGVKHRPYMRQWFERVYALHPAESEPVAHARDQYLQRLFPTVPGTAESSHLDQAPGLDPGELAAARIGSLDAMRLIDMAQALHEQGHPLYAAALYRVWIDKTQSPLRFAALYNLGTLLETMGDKPGAQSAYQGALDLNPGFDMARNSLARVHA